jgi:hypothetical protein
LGGIAVGSTKLANTTMETFTQTLNCFHCHDTRREVGGGLSIEPKNLNLSHLLTHAQFRNFEIESLIRSLVDLKMIDDD